MPDNRHEGHSEVSNMLRGYSKFLDVLEKVEKAILAVTVGIMVIIIAYQVIMRYISLPTPTPGARSWPGICSSTT